MLLSYGDEVWQVEVLSGASAFRICMANSSSPFEFSKGRAIHTGPQYALQRPSRFIRTNHP